MLPETATVRLVVCNAIRVGTAGWSIPRENAARFAPGASQLARYATCFGAVEINSSFYRPHRPATYARWAAATPDGFRFAVKMPRTITHQRRLTGVEEPLARFLEEAGALGEKLGPVLVQLPPKLPFEPAVAEAFWRDLRNRFIGDVVCEPRHHSWFTPDADQLLRAWRVARVIADPASAPHADEPGGWSGLRYLRLHGSPRIYYDAYDDACLAHLTHALARLARDAPVWCIFDNTAAGAAIVNAFHVIECLNVARARP